jgi:hypothetical protein
VLKILITLQIFTSLFCGFIWKVIKEPKRQHYYRLIAKSHNKIRTTWNIVKCESGKLHLTEQVPSVLINSDKVNDPQIIVDAFNTFFLCTTENLSLPQEERGDVISFLKKGIS